MMIQINPAQVTNLAEEDQVKLAELLKVHSAHYAQNRKKIRYYEGKIPLSEVNLGIALPDGLRGLEIGCSWGAKTVDVLAARSMFDGFVSRFGDESNEIQAIVEANDFISEYTKATRDELKFGCTFATLSADPVIGCRIRWHSPETSAALWDGEKGRIDCGFAVIDTENDTLKGWIPSLINMYTDSAIIVLRRTGNVWNAEYFNHKMGRPLMEPLIYNATSDKPFGRSRIKDPIRRLIQAYVRTVANASIGLEFATAPQKYLLGITDDQFDAVVDQKFRQYVGNILAATTNPETGEKPSFGQLQQGTISPHVEMIRILSTQFSAATGLSVTDTGVVNDANPTSSDAILAQSQTLIAMAEQLNSANGNALKTIALMALAIVNKCRIEDLSEDQKDIVPHFKNPAMPSVSATADAALKIASARPGFAQTDVFLEMIGFDRADIRRIKNQQLRQEGLEIFEEIANGTDNESTVG